MKLLVPSVQDTDETVAPCLRAGRGLKLECIGIVELTPDVAPCLRAGRGLKQGFLLGHFDFALSPRACVRGAD